MRPEAVLIRYRESRKAAESALEALSEHMAKMVDIKNAMDSEVSGGLGVGDFLVDAIDDLEVKQRNLEMAVKEHQSAYWMASHVIERLDNPRYRRVLTLRYLRLYTWSDVAYEMEITSDAAKHLGERALKSL